MAISKQPYKGTRDLFPVEKRQLDFLFNRMREIAERFSFEPYDGPLLEDVALYRAKSGDELVNEQIYSFIDRGEREVAIRPEMTPTLARMVAQIHRETPKPIRWYAIPNLMRYERPQKGRLREHWQFNCDIFGAPSPFSEIELLQLIIAFLNSFGANQNHFEILVNDRKFVENLFSKSLQISNDQVLKLYKIFDKAKKISTEALHKLIHDLQLNSNQQSAVLNYLNLDSFDEVLKLIQNHQLGESCQDFISFIEFVQNSDLKNYVKYDSSIVRGLDYYTGIVFEVFDKHPDNRRAISGGGAYSNLLKIFNEEPLPGVGFGMGDVTLTDFLKIHNFLPSFELQPISLVISFSNTKYAIKAMEIANTCREMNIQVLTLLEPQNVKKAVQFANKKQSKFFIFIGDDEISSNQISMKNLKSREEIIISLSQIKDIAKSILLT